MGYRRRTGLVEAVTAVGLLESDRHKGLGAIVGIVLARIAVFGSRTVLALIGGGLCVLAVVTTVAVMTSFSKAVDKAIPSIGNTSAAMGDLTVSDCTVTSEYGCKSTHATVTIKNTTDRTQSYMATISVNDASGTRVGEINTASNSLTTGQSVTMSGINATGTAVNDAKPGPAVCVVANVNRFPS